MPPLQHAGERGQGVGAEAEPRKGRGRGSRSQPSGQHSNEVGVESGKEKDSGERVTPVGPRARTLSSEAGWEDCGRLWIRSWQSVRILKFYILVSMKILAYINVSGPWLI